jgi:peptide/nickel transport system substrate-binding protein
MTGTSKFSGVSRRNFLVGAAAGVTAAALPSWGRVAHAAGKNHLNVGLIGFSVVNTLDPQKAALNSDFWALSAMFNGLMRILPDGSVEPDLAESVSQENDTTYIFSLRKGVKFHNGEELTAEDVKFTLDRVLSEETASPNRAKFEAIEQVEARDKYTVVLRLSVPSVPVITHLHNGVTGSQIISKKAFEDMGAEAFSKAPVGTGPFKIKEWRPSERLKMVAHTDYFRAGEPKVASCDILLIAEETSGGTAMLAGDIDLASTIPFADAPQLEADPNITISRMSGANWRYCALNLSKAPFDDVNFRRAVSMAFNRESVVKAAIFGEGSPMQGAIPSYLKTAYATYERPVCQFNPERARAEMAKGKYGEGTEAVVLTWGSGWWKRWSEIFAANINQVLGTKFTVEVTDANVAFQRYKAMEMDCSNTGWIGRMELDEYIGDCFRTGASRNFYKYSNAKVDELIDAGRAEFNPVKRGELYRMAEDLIVEECPVIFSFNNNAHNMWRTGVEGFVPTPGQHLGSQLGPVSVPS